MKILHLISEKTWRGGEQQIAYLIDELTKLGHVNLAAVSKGSVFENHCQKQNLKYFSFGFRNSTDFITSWGIYKLVRQEKPDIIHLHSSKSHGVLAIATLFGVKIPVVLSRRVDFNIKASGFSQWKYNLPIIKKIVCVSDTIKEIVKAGVKNPERAVTVYSGVDINKFDLTTSSNYLKSKYNLPSESILIGNTSALADHKDYFTFINTAKEFLKANTVPTYFFLIGEGDQRAALEDYITKKEVSKNVFLTGFLDNIPTILKELDIFLMTSKTEGLGTSVLDAFASKLPVVSTNGGGLKETVLHLKTGLSANVGDVKTLSEHLETLINNKDLNQSVIENAYKFVKNFSKESMARQTLGIYKEIIE